MLWRKGKKVLCGTKTSGDMEQGSSQWLLLRPIMSLKIRVRSSQDRSAHSLAFMMDMGAPRHPVTSMIICFATSRACQLRRGCVFTEFALEQQGMSADVIRKAFAATEEGFLSLVRKAWPTKPDVAAVGSCCLVGVIHDRTLYVANLGDSCVVMGRLVRATGEIAAVQLSTEHNANIEAVRQELQSLHPNDSHIVVFKHGVWRVKGIIQVSRSIGDVYLKSPEFNREPLAARFRLSEPLQRPVLSAEPTITSHTLQPHDHFLIFASDGLWEHLTNQEAVDMVHNHPHAGSAKRLVKAALQEAAKKREMRYSDLKKVDLGVRRHFHDDITVIVVFLDNNLISKCSSHCFAQSIRAGRIS